MTAYQRWWNGCIKRVQQNAPEMDAAAVCANVWERKQSGRLVGKPRKPLRVRNPMSDIWNRFRVR